MFTFQLFVLMSTQQPPQAHGTRQSSKCTTASMQHAVQRLPFSAAQSTEHICCLCRLSAAFLCHLKPIWHEKLRCFESLVIKETCMSLDNECTHLMLLQTTEYSETDRYGLSMLQGTLTRSSPFASPYIRHYSMQQVCSKAGLHDQDIDSDGTVNVR